MDGTERCRKTTAVIVTYESASWIRTCLESLRGVSTIVVDNASGDETPEIVRSEFPEVQLIARSTNGGYAVAVHEGAEAAGEDDVLVLNPDIVVRPGSLEVLEAYLRANPRVGMAAPRLVYPDGRPQPSVRTYPTPLTMLARRSPFGRTTLGRRILARHLFEGDTPARPRPVPSVLGAAILVRREAIRDIGGLGSWIFLYGEDLDWTWRMWDRGWEVHLVPEATMDHAWERKSRRTLDFRSAATRHHWASVVKLFLLHPQMLVGLGPSQAAEAIRAYETAESGESQ